MIAGNQHAGTSLTIGIHFDLVCPWCFIGKRHLDVARERFAQSHPAIELQATWHPVQLLPDVPPEGLPFAEFYTRRLGSAEAARQRREQVALAARAAGVELDLAAIPRMPNTARAHRLLRRVAALGEPVLYEALLDRLFAAYFQRGEDIGDVAMLRALAAEFGVPQDRLGEAAPGDARLAWAGAAVPGVPHFVFDGHLALSGAHDADTLLEAMTQGTMQAPIAADAALA